MIGLFKKEENMIKTEVYTGEEIAKKWPEVVDWISRSHMLRFEIEFDIVETQCETGEVMEYHDSGVRTITVQIREFADGAGRIKDDSLPFDLGKE